MKISQTGIGKKLPPAVFKAGRYLLRKSERDRVARDAEIRKQQDSLIQEQFDPNAENLIVYIVDGADGPTGREKLSGGVLAIASLYEETKKLPELSAYRVIMVILDSCPLLLRHVEFENDITVFRFSQVFSYFTKLRHLIIHVPELLVPIFPTDLKAARNSLAGIQDVHINIMNQNIQKMPGPEAVVPLKRYAAKVTMTTAHSRYCTPEMAERYQVSTHHLSNFCGPELYRRVRYEDKQNLLVASNDEHPMKTQILEELGRRLPALQVKIIQNMTYPQAKAANEQAKWAVTFGEGMDLYFLECVYSGGVSFAVYNDEFFPSELRSLPTVFESYEEMFHEMPKMIAELDNPAAFYECHNHMFDALIRHNRYDEYLQRLHTFYRGEYDLPYSAEGSASRLATA